MINKMASGNGGHSYAIAIWKMISCRSLHFFQVYITVINIPCNVYTRLRSHIWILKGIRLFLVLHLKTTMLFKKDQRTIKAWCWYDWANSSYSLVITSAIFPGYFLSLETSPLLISLVWSCSSSCLPSSGHIYLYCCRRNSTTWWQWKQPWCFGWSSALSDIQYRIFRNSIWWSVL